MRIRRYPLPDGRTLLAGIAESGGDAPQLGPLWELQIEGEGDTVSLGHPHNSALAELLGWNVANEEWPPWVDQLAHTIEAS